MTGESHLVKGLHLVQSRYCGLVRVDVEVGCRHARLRRLYTEVVVEVPEDVHTLLDVLGLLACFLAIVDELAGFGHYFGHLFVELVHVDLLLGGTALITVVFCVAVQE